MSTETGERPVLRAFTRWGFGLPGMCCEICGKRIWTRFNGMAVLVTWENSGDAVYHVRCVPDWMKPHLEPAE